MIEKDPDLTDGPTELRYARPESMSLIDFMQSPPVAEAIASGELDSAAFERSREFARDFTFEDEDLDG